MPVPMVVTFRMVIFPEDEVSGTMIAETIRQEIESHLEEEDGDSVDMTQSFNMDISQQTPEELLDLVRKCRNALIKTKLNMCWEIARELDKIAHILKVRSDGFSDSLSTYDWGSFLDIAKQVLNGESPVT